MNFFEFENKTKLSLRQYSILQIIKHMIYSNEINETTTSRFLSLVIIIQNKKIISALDYVYLKSRDEGIECESLRKDINFLIDKKFIKATKKSKTLQDDYIISFALSEKNKQNIINNKKIVKIINNYKTVSTRDLGYLVFEAVEAHKKLPNQKVFVSDATFD